MLKHDLITALRAMAKQKMQTFILLAGMAIGLTVSFWMFYWLIQEFSYEKVHENADRIYRIELKMNESSCELLAVRNCLELTANGSTHMLRNYFKRTSILK